MRCAHVAGMFAVLATVACGGSQGPADRDLGQQPVTSDAALTGGLLCGDSRADPWMLPVRKHTTADRFEVALVAADYAPPIIGLDSWTLLVTTSDASPVDGLTVAAKPWMPDHHHGTTVLPSVSAQGSGRYQVAQLYFFMAGVWQTTLTLSLADSTDDVQFTFCLRDAL